MASNLGTLRAAPGRLLDAESVAALLRDKSRVTLRQDRSASHTLSYYRVGRDLLETGAREGRREATAAAVEVFRAALAKDPDDPFLRNGHAAALVELAQLEPVTAAVSRLTEAVSEFSWALQSARDQEAPRAVTIRYEANLAMANWMLGELRDDTPRIEAAVELLLSALSEQPDQLPRISVDWPRAQEILGNALMSLGRPAEAREAYEAAKERWESPIDRGRCLTNLGTVYVEEGRYAEARGIFTEALATLPADLAPAARARAQFNLGTAWLRDVLAGGIVTGAATALLKAIRSIEQARDAYRDLQWSQDWLVMTIGLANAHLGYGAHLCIGGPATDRESGLRNLDEAIALYMESIPALTTSQLTVGLNDLKVAFQVLGRVSRSHAERAELNSYLVDAIVLRAWYHDQYAPAEGRYSALYYVMKLIEDPSGGGILGAMTGNAQQLISDILALLASSELPQTEWPKILRSAADRIEQSRSALPPPGRKRISAAHLLLGGATREITVPTQQEVAKTRDRLRLAGLELRFRQRLNDTDLPPDGFKDKQQYRAASQLQATFQTMTKLQAKLGLPPTEKPAAVREAQRLMRAFDRRHPRSQSAAKRQSHTP